jgi:hypothetical protein
MSSSGYLMAGTKHGQCKIINEPCSFGYVCEVEPFFCPRMESHSKEFHYSKTQRGSKWQGQSQKTLLFFALSASLSLNGIGLQNGIPVQSLTNSLHSWTEQFASGPLALLNFANLLGFSGRFQEVPGEAKTAQPVLPLLEQKRPPVRVIVSPELTAKTGSNGQTKSDWKLSC